MSAKKQWAEDSNFLSIMNEGRHRHITYIFSNLDEECINACINNNNTFYKQKYKKYFDTKNELYKYFDNQYLKLSELKFVMKKYNELPDIKCLEKICAYNNNTLHQEAIISYLIKKCKIKPNEQCINLILELEFSQDICDLCLTNIDN